MPNAKISIENWFWHVFYSSYIFLFLNLHKLFVKQNVSKYYTHIIYVLNLFSKQIWFITATTHIILLTICYAKFYTVYCAYSSFCDRKWVKKKNVKSILSFFHLLSSTNNSIFLFTFCTLRDDNNIFSLQSRLIQLTVITVFRLYVCLHQHILVAKSPVIGVISYTNSLKY